MPDTAERATQITPFLWFNNDAEAAVEFYCPSSKMATAWTRFARAVRQYVAFNGGPMYKFTEAISMWVVCTTQEEIDYYWSALTADGGHPGQCGWLKDKFGLSWQVVPEKIGELVASPGAMKALMTMKKLNLAELEAAFERP